MAGWDGSAEMTVEGYHCAPAESLPMSAIPPSSKHSPIPKIEPGSDGALDIYGPPLEATEWPTNLYPELHALGNRIVLEDGALLTPGERSDSVYFVLSGCLRSVIHSDEEHDHVIGLVRPGSVLGYVSALDGLGKLHDSVAKGRTELLAVPKPKFLKLFHSNPDFATHVIAILCSRMRATYAIVGEYTLDPRRRIARRLLRVAMSFGREKGDRTVITIRLPQEDWADMTGLSRQTINKVLRQFREEGLIIMRDGQLAILDSEKLRDVANDFRVQHTARSRTARH